MIRGLTWGNVRWLAFFSLILCMTATADGPYKLNWSIATNTFDKLQSGWKGLMVAQGQAAKALDQETQKRYGYNPLEKRAASCVSNPLVARPLTLKSLVKLKRANPATKEAFVRILGEPYCQISSGGEIWLVGTEQFLQVNYKPVSYQLKKVK